MKKHNREDAFLEQLRMIPNVSLACEKTGLSRNTVYRWRTEDKAFKSRFDDAIKSGIDSVNDLAESKLIAHLNNGNLRAIQYWLDHNKKTYARKKPRTFWEDMFAGTKPVTSISIQMPSADPEQAIQERLENLKRRDEEEQSEGDDPSLPRE